MFGQYIPGGRYVLNVGGVKLTRDNDVRENCTIICSW